MTSDIAAKTSIENKRVEILLKDRKGRWLLFTEPEDFIIANSYSEVFDALKRVHEAAVSGLWAVGYVSYEASKGFDDSLITKPPSSNFGLLWFGLFEKPAVFDNKEFCHGSYKIGDWIFYPGKEEYLSAAKKALSYIRSGDTYQVNLTVKLKANFEGDPFSFFLDLWNSQPTSLAAYLRIGQIAVCSVSPELFVESNGQILKSKPMKGTISRGLWYDNDIEMRERLRNSKKDLAENVMIVDMIRNDMGKVAQVGSVNASKLFEIEKYPSVYQMTSTVECLSKAGVHEVFKAMFPCASITGAPKTRTMQIINELETSERGIYCGSIGYAHNRFFRFNVAIRTALIDINSGAAEYGIGGGIVSDSVPENEFRECSLKAKILNSKDSEFFLIETLRWTKEEGYYLLERHLKRIELSAEYFEFVFNKQQLKHELTAAAKSFNGSARKVKVTLARNGEIQITQSILEQTNKEPVKIAIAAAPIDVKNRFIYHKTSNRKAYDSAFAERKGPAEDVVLYNSLNQITETTIANIIVEIGGEKLTPPVECGLLPGTMREEILANGSAKESILTVNDLLSADKIWLVNSVRGWREAVLIS